MREEKVELYYWEPFEGNKADLDEKQKKQVFGHVAIKMYSEDGSEYYISYCKDENHDRSKFCLVEDYNIDASKAICDREYDQMLTFRGLNVAKMIETLEYFKWKHSFYCISSYWIHTLWIISCNLGTIFLYAIFCRKYRTSYWTASKK